MNHLDEKHNLGGGKMAVRENIANIIGEANFDLDFYCFDYFDLDFYCFDYFDLDFYCFDYCDFDFDF